MELTTAVLDPPEKRTITVISSPARPTADDDSAGVTAPTDSARPSDSAEDEDSAGVDEPAVVDNLAGDADSSEEEDSAGDADPADPKDSAAADSAGGAGPVGQCAPAGTTPARSQTPEQQGHDSGMLSEDGSVIFTLLPRRINQASLLDFMSMMTLMHRRMDTVMPVPDNHDRQLRRPEQEILRPRPEGPGLQWGDAGRWVLEFHTIQVFCQKIFIGDFS